MGQCAGMSPGLRMTSVPRSCRQLELVDGADADAEDAAGRSQKPCTAFQRTGSAFRVPRRRSDLAAVVLDEVDLTVNPL